MKENMNSYPLVHLLKLFGIVPGMIVIFSSKIHNFASGAKLVIDTPHYQYVRLIAPHLLPDLFFF